MASKKRKRRSARAKSHARPRRPRRAPEPLTAAQDARYSILRRVGKSQAAIARALAERGIQIEPQSVGLVLRNKFVNEDVIAEFCAQTNTTRAEAWPDVPPLDAAPEAIAS